MSFPRVALVIAQALCNHLACTPPNPTSQKQRYHTEEHFVLQIAPFVFKCHQYLVWTCAFFETLFYLSTLSLFPTLPTILTSLLSLHPSLTPSTPLQSPTLTHLICPLPQTYPPLSLTPLFTLGVLAVVLGTYIRLDCFRALGPLFTFDLTIHPAHTLITSRFYAHVRHPAYTGSMLVVAGLALSHLSSGAWMTSCGPLGVVPRAAGVVWAAWWVWTVAVGLSRAQAEDREMQRVFGKEWEAYARAVPWWFVPGIL
ncbi:hypothetical protein DXG03_007484 [Asterophora parasitica]|uniref:Protein-S-isoprenylcysteine O-methyltransferase n=1 Tax=Asterophora parasitica TaxID=117018 RepID=A0A9P7G263_9AGAR|nr:hypothetical protein DXG03_007484 [Asterophora parasitica]